MKRSIGIMVGIVVALLLAGGAFWQGMSVGKAQAQSDEQAFLASRGFAQGVNGANGASGANGGTGGFGANGAGGTGGFGGRLGQNGVNGTVEKVDGNTITVTTNQGDTVTVQVPGNTPILKSTSGTLSDLKPGTHILAIGDRSGNNVAARGVQITDRPAGFENLFPGGFGGGRARGGATPTPATK